MARPELIVPVPQLRSMGTLAASVPASVQSEVVPSGNPWDGVIVKGGSCGDIWRIDISCEPLTGTETTGQDGWGDPYEFAPFVVYVNKQCALLSGIDLAAMARTRLGQGIGKQIAAELYSGSITGNPSIIADPVVIDTGDAGIPPCEALQLLISHLGDDIGNLEAYIHVTPRALELLAAEDCVQWDGQVFRTHVGHVVIGDAGYDGQVPTIGGVAEPALAAGEEFFYATGPISWFVNDQEDSIMDTGYMNARTNQIEARAQRLAIATFDPDCIHLAVRAAVCGNC